MFCRIVSVVTAAAFLTYSSTALAQEAEETALISVLTDGEVCTVYVDGEKQDTPSPTSLFVTPGEHTIAVMTPDGDEKEKEITAEANKKKTVRFTFEPPEPVKRAAKGEFDPPSGAAPVAGGESSTFTNIAVGLAGLCAIGGAVVIAYNYGGDSEGLDPLRVDDDDITLSVRTNLETADGDQIDLYVNGVQYLDNYELTTTDNIVSVSLDSGSNIVKIIAENEGSSPPNTGVLTVSDVVDGDSMQEWSLAAGGEARQVITAP